MRLAFEYGQESVTLEVEPENGSWRVRLPDAAERRIQVQRLPNDVLQITEDTEGGERTFRVPFARTERGIEFSYGGQVVVFSPAASRQARGKKGRASGALTAPMVGIVVDVKVQVGQKVEAYQPLVVVEAMKVMATVDAPFAGTVQAVHVEKGQRVAHGALLVEVVPQSEASEKDSAER